MIDWNGSDSPRKRGENTNNKNRIYTSSWSKGLTKETSASIRKSVDTIARKYKSGELKHYFKDKVIIITGSSQGIGRETGERLLSSGASVVFTGRDKGKLRALKVRLNNNKAFFLSLDFYLNKF